MALGPLSFFNFEPKSENVDTMRKGLSPLLVLCLSGAIVFSADAALVIKPQPVALTVNAGSTASFTVGTPSAGPVSCQWQLMGTNLAGETNLNLSIENVSTNQAGSYRAIVGAGGLTATSAAVKLTVIRGTIVHFSTALGEITVELFDHDKPVTVENFLHYYNFGSYDSMFFHRLAPGFVLQGGGYGTTNQSDTPLVITNITDLYQLSSARYEAITGAYGFVGIQNEYSHGPCVRNTFGTLAMARNSYQGAIVTNSANSQWFFNLGDNSTNLDNVSGGFTVFGRVISGTNTLNAFNGLSTNNGILNLSSTWSSVNATNAPSYWASDGSGFTDLPVQSGTAYPNNSQLFFAKMTVDGKAFVDKVAPRLTLSYPAPNSHLTNNTFTMRGTISDNEGIACLSCWVYYYSTRIVYPLPVTDFANWQIDSTNIPSQTLTNMPAGRYNFELDAWDGYGNSIGGYIPIYIMARLSVQTNGLGSVSPNWNGKYLDTVTTQLTAQGDPVPAQYTITATPKAGQLFAGWSGEGVSSPNPKLTFTMKEGLVLTAAFASNYYPRVQATYSGLFSPTNGDDTAATNSGAFGITVSGAGQYTGHLLLGGQQLALGGAFNYAGLSQATVKLPKSTNTLSVVMTIDLTNGTGIVTGSVSGLGWTSDLKGYRGIKKTAAEKYVLDLPASLDSTGQPAGDGYAIASVSAAGLVSVAGKVADGATFASGTTVAQGGQWPLCAFLYGGQGLIIGWQNLTNASAPVRWVRPASAGGAYPAFSADLSAASSLYAKPASAAAFQIMLDSGPLQEPVSGSVSINPAGLCAVAGDLAGRLKLSLSVSTALVTGKYTPAAGPALALWGAFQNATNGAAGFFTNSAGLSGRLTIH